MERELTGKETAKSFIVLIAIFLLASTPDGDYSIVTFIRLLIAIILGIVGVAYQYHCMHSPLNKEGKNGK